jgi:hypothetical protein
MRYVIIFLLFLNIYTSDTIKYCSIFKPGKEIPLKKPSLELLSEIENPDNGKKFKRLFASNKDKASSSVILQKPFELYAFYKIKKGKINSFIITKKESTKENNERIEVIHVCYFSKNNIKNMFEYFLKKTGKNSSKTEVVITTNCDGYVAPIYNAYHSKKLEQFIHINNKNNLNIFKYRNWIDKNDL